MEPGPLPPHERSWRHPSELGPTAADLDERGVDRTMVTALATGAVAVFVVVALVVATIPSPPSTPVALSATTSPGLPATPATPATAAAAATATPGGDTATAPVRPRAIGVAAQPIGLASFSALPNAVASGPEPTLDGRGVAEQEPAALDPVYLHTDAVTYRADWHDIEHLTRSLGVPDGSVVFDTTGSVVAYVRDGRLVTLVGG